MLEAKGKASTSCRITPLPNMPTPRFHTRLALLGLELRRLWREPWPAYASLMLLPLAWVLLLAGERKSSAPGAELFQILVWWWCAAAHLVLLPLMGLAFRGEDKRDELEALQIAGYSGFSLCAGMLGSRLVTTLAILLIPMPAVVLCYLLGGLSGPGLAAAGLHLPAHFLCIGGLYAFLGVSIPSATWYWFVSITLAVLQTLTGLAGPALAGASRIMALALGEPPAPGPSPALVQLGLGVVLLLASGAGLVIRLRWGSLAGEASSTRRPWTRPRERPTAKDPIRWKERWFGLGGSSSRWIRLGWGPFAAVLLVLLPTLLAWKGWAEETLPLAGFALIFPCGLVMSIVHGIRSAHLLFARERAGGTMDDLALARGRILFVVHAKIKEYGVSSRELWRSSLWGMALGFLVLFPWMRSRDADMGLLIAALVIVAPVAGFLVYRIQEGFVTDLFRAWSGPDGLSPIGLMREGSRFVASLLCWMILVPLSLVLLLFTYVFALILIPIVARAWVTFFKDSLVRSQRALCIQLCQEYQDPDFWAELNRMFPNPDRSKRTPSLK